MGGKASVSHLLIALALSCAAVQACVRVSRVVKPWTGGFQGEFNIPVSSSIQTWSARIAFEHSVSKLEIWSAESRKENDNTFILTPKDYNAHIGSGGNLYLGFVVHYNGGSTGTNPCLTFFPGQSSPGSGSGNNPQPTNPPVVTSRPVIPGDGDSGVVKTPGAKYNYDEVLYKGLLFYEAQRSGKLPSDNKIPWRGDSGLSDGKDVGHDLTGGWHDAGDHVKFGLPMASSATLLLYGMEFFKKGYEYAGQLGMAKRQVRWALDYFVKCHVEKNKLYVQVAEPDDDHSWWGRPEDNHQFRPSYWIGAGKPTGGADVAGETAAALAAGAAVFKDESAYRATLLSNAKSIYNLGKANPGTYNNIVPKVTKFYGSTQWKDEMAHAAAWLAYAVGKNDPSYNSYLNDAKSYMSQLGGVPWSMSWEEKRPAIYFLMFKLTGDNKYLTDLEAFLREWRPGGSVPRTRQGMVLRDKWGSNRYAGNAALVALLAAKAGSNARANHEFATKQINIILGDGGRSYVVGFGNNPPQRPHHKAASCPWKPAPCGWDNFRSSGPNPHVIEGALVGGPGNTDGWFDDNREKFEFTEVATDYNSGFCGALAGIKYFLVNPL